MVVAQKLYPKLCNILFTDTVQTCGLLLQYMIHNDVRMRFSYVEILHVYVVIDRQLQESEQRGPPLTQLAFHTVNSLNVPSHKNRVGVRSGERGSHAMGPPRPMQCSPNVPYTRCISLSSTKLYSSIIRTERIKTNICQRCVQSDHASMMCRDTCFYSAIRLKVASDITIVYVRRWQWHNYWFPIYGCIRVSPALVSGHFSQIWFTEHQMIPYMYDLRSIFY